MSLLVYQTTRRYKPEIHYIKYQPHDVILGLAYYSRATPRPLGVTLRSCMLDAELFLQSQLVPHKKHTVPIKKTLSSASEGILQTPK